MARLPDTFAPHPARDAAKASMAAVEAADREKWLALFADDAVVEDPIGPSVFDPEGIGHRGRTAIGDFYDQVIAPNAVTFDIAESFAAGSECANIGSITTVLPDGSTVVTHGVFTYRVDTEGRIVALRAYWEMDRLEFVQPV